MARLLTSEEVREPLGEYCEGLLALAMNGEPFTPYAARTLLSEYGCYSGTRYYLLLSALRRKDREAARIFLRDWQYLDRLPSANVSKFIPGEHYYALDRKFDTREEAEEYLRGKGCRVGEFIEKHVYRTE